LRFSKALLVARKDWKEIFSSRSALVSLAFFLFIPAALIVFLAALAPMLGPGLGQSVTKEELARLRALFPEASWMDARQLTIYMAGALIAPFLFTIMPLAASSIITADSFAGEKERKTIEPLLAAPISEAELFLGKVLAAFLPVMALLYASFGLTCVLVNAFTADLFGHPWFPPLRAWLMVCVIAPLYAFLGMCLVIVGSSRANSVRDASNYAAVLILPLLALLLAQVAGALALGTAHILAAAGGLTLTDVLVFKLAYRSFNREALVITR